MPRFPSDDGDEGFEWPEECPGSDGGDTTIATTDPDEDWDWADEG